jgi:predicted phosphodiesterase
MKAIRCDLPNVEQIEIHPMADLHIGDSMSDFKLIMERIEHIKNTPNAYCILDGDLMDTAIASSIGDTYAAHLQPMEQLKLCVKLFEPIKDKILCIVPGNHENRVYKSDGIDTTAMMAAQLGLSDKYSETTAILFIRFGSETRRASEGRKMVYSVYVTHGSGGGRREGGKINRLADLAQIVDADVYLCGHTHLPAVFREGYFRTSKNSSNVQYVDRLFVNAAAALNYGGYGDRAGFKPASKQSPVIFLNGKRHGMYAKI